ncbi:MAG: zinc chelation protein SecC [Methylobacter sp.]|nr:MAG: zinc chelation protein SecC [Methylobacter sp.]
MMTSQPCPCGSKLDYSACCGRYHSSAAVPETAEALMRSRYSAYVLNNSRYLLATWSANTKPNAIDFSKDTAVWQALEIHKTQKGGAQDSKGVVEFKAYFLQDGEQQVLHEISRFQKLGGRWFYLDGIIKTLGKTTGSTVNLGKNAACPCGSGKKFKRCCGAG